MAKIPAGKGFQLFSQGEVQAIAGRAALFTDRKAEELLKALYHQHLSPLLPIAYCKSAQREAL